MPLELMFFLLGVYNKLSERENKGIGEFDWPKLVSFNWFPSTNTLERVSENVKMLTPIY